MKEHGDEKKEKERGQVAIKRDDFDKIPDILKKPDITIIGAKREGKNMMLYAKEMRDGTTLYFEEILSGKENRTLRGKTMFKRNGGIDKEKLLNIITNRERTDVSKAKIIVGAGGRSGVEASMNADLTAATSAQADTLNISHSVEKSSGFTAAETGNSPPLERRNFNSKENYMADEQDQKRNINMLTPKEALHGGGETWWRDRVEKFYKYGDITRDEAIKILQAKAGYDSEKVAGETIEHFDRVMEWERQNPDHPNSEFYEWSKYNFNSKDNFMNDGEMLEQPPITLTEEEKWNLEEDVWIKDERVKNTPPFYDEILKHNFENPHGQTVLFGIKYDLKNPYLRFEFNNKSQDIIDFYDVPENNDLKKTVENIINHFTNTQVDKDKMDLYVKEQVKSFHESFSSRENYTAQKAGYVQGVCECVAAMFGDKNMGKKLLSEMRVTKEMAEKYANPETYKILEQGVFAPDHEQKQEQRQSRGRGR